MNTQRLAVFFDCSGSLMEHSRKFLLQYISSLLNDSLDNASCETQFFMWNTTITLTSFPPSFIPQGVADLSILSAKIKELTLEKPTFTLIITDGAHSDSQKKDFANSFERNFSYPIAAGLIGAGSPEVLRPLCRKTTPFPADSLPLFLTLHGFTQ